MLKKFYPYEYVDSIFAVNYEKLYQMGYRGLIFDIDNTLVHHGEDSTPEVDDFFVYLHKLGFKTLLLTNNNQERVLKFTENIDTMYIYDADKPSTTNYYKAMDMLKTDKGSTIFLGDQLFTDIYGANRCQIPNILVKFMRYPEEKKIGKKRMVEKVILAFYRLRKKYTHRLGNISVEKEF